MAINRPDFTGVHIGASQYSCGSGFDLVFGITGKTKAETASTKLPKMFNKTGASALCHVQKQERGETLRVERPCHGKTRFGEKGRWGGRRSTVSFQARLWKGDARKNGTTQASIS